MPNWLMPDNMQPNIWYSRDNCCYLSEFTKETHINATNQLKSEATTLLQFPGFIITDLISASPKAGWKWSYLSSLPQLKDNTWVIPSSAATRARPMMSDIYKRLGRQNDFKSRIECAFPHRGQLEHLLGMIFRFRPATPWYFRFFAYSTFKILLPNLFTSMPDFVHQSDIRVISLQSSVCRVRKEINLLILGYWWWWMLVSLLSRLEAIAPI